ncbi:MAG TPA: hypothetical protein VGM17_06480 [Rhizomicrobium sp.]|jgi:hypothetical protein
MIKYILVLDKYAEDDRWCYSAIADTAEELRALPCYNDPPNSDPKDGWIVISSEGTSKRRCGSEEEEEPGTIYGLRSV